ncbi:post-GPI attachment to proteins factor 3-like [Populus alba x Populus x berolinensis]|nr:post-GPI attachment to proteins factor 3-like [Populus alba x Populus x berolinensis]
MSSQDWKENRFFHISITHLKLILFLCSQEPVSVALSALNLAIQFHVWVSFFILISYKLQLTPSKKTYYEYTGLWPIYGILSMNSWFWSAVFHSRDVELTEKLDCSSAVALLGFSFILTILRAFNMRDEAARVMVSAPIIAFVTTHILYLNFYNLDYSNCFCLLIFLLYKVQ